MSTNDEPIKYDVIYQTELASKKITLRHRIEQTEDRNNGDKYTVTIVNLRGLESRNSTSPGCMTTEPMPLPGILRQLFVDLGKEHTLPESIYFGIRYVSLTKVDNPRNKPSDNQLCLLYDYWQNDRGEVFRPCMYAKIRAKDLFGDLLSVANNPPTWLYYSGHISHEIQLEEESWNRKTGASHADNGCRIISVRDQIRIERNPHGEYCRSLPLPGFSHGKRSTNSTNRSHAESDNYSPPAKVPKVTTCVGKAVWEQLEKINRIVRSDSGSKMLLTGSPGSGKEIYARIIHYGSMRQKYNAPFKTISVAGLPLDELRKALFGTEPKQGEHGNGLLAEAKGGTIFLDEFDKVKKSCKKDFYSILLRVLESNEYYPYESIKKQKVEDVNWILAGAFSTRDNAIPPDIWSRLNDELQLVNPTSEDGYTASLFLIWYFEFMVKGLGISNLQKLCDENSYHADLARYLLLSKDEKFDNDHLLKPGENLLSFAKQFERALCGKGLLKWLHKNSLSIRAVRQATRATSRYLFDKATRKNFFSKSNPNSSLAPINLFFKKHGDDALGEAKRIIDMIDKGIGR